MGFVVLTLDRLKELLHYDPDTGVFTWIKNGNNQFMRAGRQAGSIDDGYRRIHIDNRRYMAGHLAFLYMTGSLPKVGMTVDHIDRIRDNNRWDNLREATDLEQCLNRAVMDTAKGSLFKKDRPRPKPWQARISVNNRKISLGYYRTEAEAIEAYRQAVIKYRNQGGNE